jgi:hypothetical protein
MKFKARLAAAACVLTVSGAAIGVASPAQASSGTKGCGPSAKIQTNAESTTNATHTHSHVGITYTFYGVSQSYVRWNSLGGSWSAYPYGYATCWV